MRMERSVSVVLVWHGVLKRRSVTIRPRESLVTEPAGTRTNEGFGMAWCAEEKKCYHPAKGEPCNTSSLQH